MPPFDSIDAVRKKRVKKEERPIFDSVRKPTAPKSQKFGGDRPEEKIHPTQRKAKHKNKAVSENLNDEN